jgi:poly(A) polymerase
MLKLLHSGHAYACLNMLRNEGLSSGIFPLLDAVMDDSGGQAFIKLALDSTDERIRADKPVSVGFLLATLLWQQVNQRWLAFQRDGEKPIPALMNAMSDVESEQDNEFAIPRRFSATMREIWTLQPRFDSRVGQRPFRLLEQPRFRAAYDFLVLRAEVGEVPKSLVKWWGDFQDADDDRRLEMIRTAKEEPAASAAPRKRRRRRKPAGQGGQGGGGA